VSKRFFSILFGLAVLAVIAGVGIGVLRATDNLGFGPTGDCSATVNGHTVEIDSAQAENATLIASIAMERGMPARATSIALATAMQESKLRNISGGDRDSVGLFQQRPSQGWGTPSQLMDRVYATNAFFDALQKINGYESMEITVAAQKVQRSAYPDAYAAHEADARALASALTGYSPAAFSCNLSGGAPSSDTVHTSSGLTGRANAVRSDLQARFGALPVTGASGSAGTTLQADVSAQADPQTYGWALAQYLAGNAGRLQIRTIDFDGHEWRAGQQGWQTAKASSTQVRIEVFD